MLEMIPCPICGKPMPKKRRELGYNYCIDCSTEDKKVCVVEGTIEGDGVQSDVIILTKEQEQTISRLNAATSKTADDESLDLQTFEQQEINAILDAETKRQSKLRRESSEEIAELDEESENML